MYIVMGTPINYIDFDGRDPKKLSHWVRFGKESFKAIGIVTSFGFEIAGQVDLGGKKIGGDINILSQNIAGLKDGVGFHLGDNFDKIPGCSSFRFLTLQREIRCVRSIMI